MDAVEALEQAARACAMAIEGRGTEVAFVATSYDTDFEPVADQIDAKIRELSATYGVDGPARWSLWIVDDLPAAAGFSEAARIGVARHPSLAQAGRLQVMPMISAAPRPGGLKGRAILDGFAAALAAGAEVLVYLNLNLKVPAGLSARGLAPVLAGALDVASGSRAARDGGVVRGAGPLGRLKSRAYSRMACAALPPLAEYADPTAPMKIFTATAARHLLDGARLEHATFDCEWLLLCELAGLRLGRFPIAWVQRPGSSPPWHLVAKSVGDVLRLRRRWRRGEMG